MTRFGEKFVSLMIILTMLISLISVTSVGSFAAEESGIIDAEGWFESAYAEWAPVSGADGYNAYISDGSAWVAIDSQLIRSYGSYLRVDAVGLKAGSYQIKIIPTSNGSELADKALITSYLAVSAYDRSGYAHFNYSEGVGAYNDDGTLKDGAIVLYVTDENKDSVSVTSKDGTTVVGIGNILNSVGQDVGGGKTSKGGIANTNADIIRKLALDGTPLVVRIIGNVTAPKGLTEFDSVNYGGSVGDNGFMARMSGGKDITIEGIGSDAMINGWGLHFICQTADYQRGIGKSFEVRNVAFRNVPEDCVGMEGQQEDSTLTAPVERCWIHNCSFYAPVISNPAESDKDGGDGACDFKRGQYFTNSYCLYDGYHKTNLVGSSDSSLQYHITYHHNYWRNCESRGPLARQANIHMYNNIFEGQTSYCMNPRANAYIFSEYNMFFKSKNPVQIKSGAVKSYGDSFASCTGDNGATVVTDRATKVSSGNRFENFDTDPALSYIPSGDYIIQESIAEMKAVVTAYAGPQKDKIITPEDANTSVIPADQYPTSALVLDYSKKLNKSYIASSGTYDNIVFNLSKFNAEYISLGGSTTSCNIVFYVDTAVNVTVEQHSESSNDVVLCNAIGESLLVGGGTVENIPSGYYFLQSNVYDVGSGKYKEAKITGLTVTAVDPGASTTPIPTPPPTTDPDQGGDNTGSGDNTGGSGNTGGSDVTIPVGSYTHNVTENGTTDPTGFFTLGGATSPSKGDVSYAGLTLSTCLKVSSSAYIRFTAPADGKVTFVFNKSNAGYTLKINGGDPVAIPSDGILSFDVTGGTAYEVLKAKSESFLYYLVYTPNVTHTHDYFEEETKAATCTEAGLLTFVCSCGDSYTEKIDARGHSFDDGFCVDCGEIDPNADNGETHICDCWVDADGDTICDNCGSGGLTPPDNGENSDNGNTPDGGETPDEEEPEQLNFFQRIWRAIVNFFRKLFGIKED